MAAVVPVLDEGAAIGDVVAELQTCGACCVYVIDGGSRDRTVGVAKDAGGIVVVEPERGYGRACRTGAEHALASAPDGHTHDAVAFLDGDGSCDPRDLRGLIAALEGGDVALGSRPAHLLESGAMPWHARLGNLLVSWIVGLRTGRTVHDLPPFKVVHRAILERLALSDDGYGWTAQMVARAMVEPMVRIRETPVRFRNRRGGVSKVSG
ncbi:MAG: glycosyltransferase family 2 protein, partial [Chloroflexota bacterium]